jgi:hypothetical protein
LWPFNWDSNWNTSANEQSTEASAAPVETNEDQSGYVQQLADEVDRLREEQAGSRHVVVAQPSSPTPTHPTILAFRDGQKLEVQDYAIMGQTLWAFSGDASRKISLAELDLPGTKRLNEERGINFVLPAETR